VISYLDEVDTLDEEDTELEVEILKGNKNAYFHRTYYLKAISFEKPDALPTEWSVDEFLYTRGFQTGYLKHGYSVYLEEIKLNTEKHNLSFLFL